MPVVPVTQRRSYSPLSTPAATWPRYRLEQAGVSSPVQDWTNTGVTRRNDASGNPALSYYVDLALDPSAWYTIIWDKGDGNLTDEAFSGAAPQTGDAFARIGAPTGANIAADIATRSTYAGADTAGTTTLLARLGSPVGASIAADIQTRLPTTAYTAPDNASLADLVALNGGTPIAGTVNDGAPSASMFTGDSGLSAVDNIYLKSDVCFLTGALSGLKRPVAGYTGSGRKFRVFPPFPFAPANGDTFRLI
jgi:hypothetical protein